MNEHYPILVVEDNDEDFEMLCESLLKCGTKNEILRYSNGEDAMNYLFEQNRNALTSRPMPALVIMDLNLSGYDGRYVLNKMKEHPKVRKIPVVILTTSSNPKDVDFCYSKGISGYLIKPVDLNKFERLISLLKELMIDSMILPGGQLP